MRRHDVADAMDAVATVISLDVISEESVREALRALRFGKPMRGNPLLGTVVLAEAMRREGIARTADGWAWRLGRLLDEISAAELARLRADGEGGAAASVGDAAEVGDERDARGHRRVRARGDRHDVRGLRDVRADFAMDRPDLEAMSILRFRYFADTRRQLAEVATELGVVYRTLARRLSRGHELLADALRAAELAARQRATEAEGEGGTRPGTGVEAEAATDPRASGAGSRASGGGSRPSGAGTERDEGGHRGEGAASRGSGEASRVGVGPPRPMDRFIGRRTALSDLAHQLRAHRLVTVTGPGGIGKTRLALEAVGSGLLPQGWDVVWCDLAATAQPHLVASAVARALGVDDGGADDEGAIERAVGDREVLLLLDNCEHVVGSCAVLVERLLRACPGLRCLVTSREVLRAEGELVWRVEPLRTAAERDRPAEPVPSAEPDEATELFLTRLNEATPQRKLSAREHAVVAAICARLDGIPLAIELAAARAGVLSIDELAERLGDRFALLSRGRRTARPRHRTLRAAIDWGHALLGEDERVLLRRLSVFRGWTVRSAEQVAADALLPEEAVLDALAGLVDTSFVTATWDEGTQRFRMLETIRAYAAEQLAEAGERGAVVERHVGWARELAEEAADGLRGPDQARWLRRLDAEHDDLRASMDDALDRSRAAVHALRLATALAPYWLARGYVTEGRARLERCLEVVGEGGARAEGSGDHRGVAEHEGSPSTMGLAERAAAMSAAGAMARQQADYPAAAAWLRSALALQQDAGDEEGRATTLRHLGNVAEERGERDEAERAYGEALSIYERLGSDWGVAAVHNNLGLLAYHGAEFGAARRHLERSLTVFEAQREAMAANIARFNLAKVSQDEGDWEGAEAQFERCLAESRALGDLVGVSGALAGLGHVALRRGDVEAARRLFQERLPMVREVGDQQDAAEWMEGMAEVERRSGNAERAVELWGAAAALRERIGAPEAEKERVGNEAERAALRGEMGEEGFEGAWGRGREWG